MINERDGVSNTWNSAWHIGRGDEYEQKWEEFWDKHSRMG